MRGFGSWRYDRGQGFLRRKARADVVPYGRLFTARIEDILQEDVMMASCDAMLPL